MKYTESCSISNGTTLTKNTRDNNREPDQAKPCPVKLHQTNMCYIGWLSRNENHGMISTAGNDLQIVIKDCIKECREEVFL